MIKQHACFLVALALVAPVAFAQQQSKPTPPPNPSLIQLEHNMQRQALHNDKAMELGDRKAARDALANLARLRTHLASAWQHMGLSQEAADKVARAYDPTLASQMHHAALRGKTDTQVADMLRSAVATNRFLVADQMLIDYERQRLSLGEMASGDAHETLGGM